MTGPQKLKPRCLRALDIAADSAVSVGTSAELAKRFKNRTATDEGPQPGRKAFTVLDLEKSLRAPDRGRNLAAMANDPGIGQCAGDSRLVPAGDALGIETLELVAKGLALAQDRDPGKPGLKAVEDQLFPQRAGITFRHPPLAVVIGHI